MRVEGKEGSLLDDSNKIIIENAEWKDLTRYEKYCDVYLMLLFAGKFDISIFLILVFREHILHFFVFVFLILFFGGLCFSTMSVPSPLLAFSHEIHYHGSNRNSKTTNLNPIEMMTIEIYRSQQCCNLSRQPNNATCKRSKLRYSDKNENLISQTEKQDCIRPSTVHRRILRTRVEFAPVPNDLIILTLPVPLHH